MDEDFEGHRDHLRAVAHRMLGSGAEADDAVQEAWLRLAHTDRGGIRNTRAWLTTVVGRICLDMLRARTSRREVQLAAPAPVEAPDPEQEALLADSVGRALTVVLDTLTPAERVAFVLHDTFAVPFPDVARVLGRSVPAVKMLASRARRRVRAGQAPGSDPARQAKVVSAFLDAARRGDFDALLELLDPGVTARAGGTSVHGADAVARQALAYARRAARARVGCVDGVPVILVPPGGRLELTIVGGLIVDIEVTWDSPQGEDGAGEQADRD